MEPSPGTADVEMIFKIYTIPQAAIDGTVDFSDPTLIGVAYYQAGNVTTEQAGTIIIFDNTTFNQDIYATTVDVGGGTIATNYYIELEQMALASDEASMATLKNMRNTATQTAG